MRSALIWASLTLVSVKSRNARCVKVCKGVRSLTGVFFKWSLRVHRYKLEGNDSSIVG